MRDGCPIDRLAVTWIRTATLLLELGDFRVLTDPWFGRRMRVLPVFAPPGVDRDDLPTVDLLLVSHLHADHFSVADARELARKNRDIRAIVCPGGARALHDAGVDRVEELAPGSATHVGPLEITATRCLHTGPPPDEVNYVLRWAGGTIFFGGDARFSDAFDEIARRFVIDLALLPIGGTLIFGHRTTMDPADALGAARRLGARYVIPTHEGMEWMPVPPASWHPGRTRDFERLCRDEHAPIEAVRLERGERAWFEVRDGRLALERTESHPDGRLVGRPAGGASVTVRA